MPPPASAEAYSLVNPPRVADLLARHKDDVAFLLEEGRKYVATGKDPARLELAAKHAPLDELFAVRFLLSAKSDRALALERLCETLEFRAAHHVELEEARKGNVKYRDVMLRYTKVGYLGNLGGLHPVVVVRAGHGSTAKMFSEGGLNADQITESLLYATEEVYHKVDELTRKTGLLCKQVAVIDLQGFSMFKLDSKFPRAQGKASNLSMVYYPQLLARAVGINPPTVFQILFQTFRAFASKASLEKQTICPGRTLKDSVDKCPFVSQFANRHEVIPKFLGGHAPCPADLVLEDQVN